MANSVTLADWAAEADDPNRLATELAAAPPSQFPSRVKKPINSLATIAELRTVTKTKQQQRQFTSVVPGAEEHHVLWVNRFNWFRVHVLEESDSDTPNGHQLERFVDGFVHYMGRRAGAATAATAVTSESTLKAGVKVLVKHCEMTYEDFSYTKHHKHRIDSAIADLIKQGLVGYAAGPVREPLWITSDLIHRMNTAVMKDAIIDGTLSWDGIIFDTMVLSLQSALAARFGDTARTASYKGTEYLAYKDIRICWANTSDGKGKLMGTITLRAEKGNKLDEARQRVIEVHEVQSPDFNVCCVLKMILIWALRIGAVAETSWTQLMTSIQARRSKRVVWVKPELPLLCAVRDYLKPTNYANLHSALKKGADRIGLLAVPVLHDIRRGAARELAHLPTAADTNHEAARLALGHNRASFQRGVTDEYVGGSAGDTWGLRLRSSSTVLGIKHAIDTADEPYKRPRTRTPKEIEEACARLGLDSSRKADRLAASLRLRREHHEEWMAKQQRERDEVPPVVSSSGDSVVLPGSSSNAVPSKRNGDFNSSELEAFEPRPQSGEDGPERQEPAGGSSRTAMSSNWNGDVSGSEFEPSESEEDEPERQEPAGGSSRTAMSSNWNGSETSGWELDVPEPDKGGEPEEESAGGGLTLASKMFDPTGSSQEALLWNLSKVADEKGTLPVTCAALTSDRDTFGTFFSEINIIKASNTESYLHNSKLRSLGDSSSRGPPERYLHLCPNSTFGCEAKFWFSLSKEAHFKTCKSSSEADHLKYIQVYKHVCRKGCGARYQTSGERREHEEISAIHWVPRKCTEPDCTSDETFQSHGDLLTHRDLAHRGYTRSCPVQGCKRAGVIFRGAQNLRKHLIRMHGWTSEQAGPYMPRPKGQSADVPEDVE